VESTVLHKGFHPSPATATALGFIVNSERPVPTAMPIRISEWTRKDGPEPS